MTFCTLVTSVSPDQEGHACTRMGVRDQFVALLVARVHEVLQPSAVDPVHAQSNQSYKGLQHVQVPGVPLPSDASYRTYRFLLRPSSLGFFLACYRTTCAS